jgi:hypothetical protein
MATAGLVGATMSPQADARADAAALMPLHLGSLTITSPASFPLGDAMPGQKAISRLGTVRVEDTRGPDATDWTATVSATDLTSGEGTPITKSHISYRSGPATRTTGDGTFVPGQPTPSSGQPLTTTRVAFSHVKGMTDNTASWRPTLVISVPDTAAADEYSGAVIHSVA